MFKKFLLIYFALQLTSAVIMFFLSLPKSVIVALIYLLIGVLQSIVTFAIVRCLDVSEQLKIDNDYLRSKIYRLEQQINPVQVAYQAESSFDGEESGLPWKCIKCGTVNKAGTNTCENCNAEFSAELNPTYISNPKKMSRFLKEKKFKNQNTK